MQRMKNISVLRLIATIFVFVSHILFFTVGSYVSDIYFPFYFGVNIFIFISAYLYSNKQIESASQFYKKQYIKLLVPVLIYLAAFFVAQAIINPSAYASLDAINPIANLWYVFVISVCYALIPVLAKVKQQGRKSPWIILLVAAVACELAVSVAINLQVCLLNFVLTYLLLAKKSDSPVAAALGGICFLGGGGIYALLGIMVLPLVKQGLPLSLFLTFRQYIVSLMGGGFAICFLYLFKFLNNAKPSKFLASTDKYSYCFYIVQQCFMVGSFNLLGRFYLWIDVVCITLLCCACAWILQTLSDKVVALVKRKT